MNPYDERIVTNSEGKNYVLRVTNTDPNIFQILILTGFLVLSAFFLAYMLSKLLVRTRLNFLYSLFISISLGFFFLTFTSLVLINLFGITDQFDIFPVEVPQIKKETSSSDDKEKVLVKSQAKKKRKKKKLLLETMED